MGVRATNYFDAFYRACMILLGFTRMCKYNSNFKNVGIEFYR